MHEKLLSSSHCLRHSDNGDFEEKFDQELDTVQATGPTCDVAGESTCNDSSIGKDPQCTSVLSLLNYRSRWGVVGIIGGESSRHVARMKAMMHRSGGATKAANQQKHASFDIKNINIALSQRTAWNQRRIQDMILVVGPKTPAAMVLKASYFSRSGHPLDSSDDDNDDDHDEDEDASSSEEEEGVQAESNDETEHHGDNDDGEEGGAQKDVRENKKGSDEGSNDTQMKDEDDESAAGTSTADVSVANHEVEMEVEEKTTDVALPKRNDTSIDNNSENLDGGCGASNNHGADPSQQKPAPSNLITATTMGQRSKWIKRNLPPRPTESVADDADPDSARTTLTGSHVQDAPHKSPRSKSSSPLVARRDVLGYRDNNIMNNYPSRLSSSPGPHHLLNHNSGHLFHSTNGVKVQPMSRPSIQHGGCINTACWLNTGWRVSLAGAAGEETALTSTYNTNETKKCTVDFSNCRLDTVSTPAFNDECATQLITAGDDRVVKFWDVSGALGSTSPVPAGLTTHSAFLDDEDPSDHYPVEPHSKSLVQKWKDEFGMSTPSSSASQRKQVLRRRRDTPGSVIPLGTLHTGHRGNILHVTPVPGQPGKVATCAIDGYLMISHVEHAIGPPSQCFQRLDKYDDFDIDGDNVMMPIWTLTSPIENNHLSNRRNRSRLNNGMEASTIVVSPEHSQEGVGDVDANPLAGFLSLFRSTGMCFSHQFVTPHAGLLCSERGLHVFDLRLNPREQPRQSILQFPPTGTSSGGGGSSPRRIYLHGGSSSSVCKACAVWDPHHYNNDHRRHRCHNDDYWDASLNTDTWDDILEGNGLMTNAARNNSTISNLGGGPTYVFAGGASPRVGLYDLRMRGTVSSQASQRAMIESYQPKALKDSATVSVSGLDISRDGRELLVCYENDHIYRFPIGITFPEERQDLSLTEQDDFIESFSTGKDNPSTSWENTSDALAPSGDDSSPSMVPASTAPTIKNGYEPDADPSSSNREESIIAPKPVSDIASYGGHLNRLTILKGAKFAGPKDEYICTGSDSGHAFMYERLTGRVAALLKADRHTCNGLIPHPSLPVFVSYGIDSSAKIWRSTTPLDVCASKSLRIDHHLPKEMESDTNALPNKDKECSSVKDELTGMDNAQRRACSSCSESMSYTAGTTTCTIKSGYHRNREDATNTNVSKHKKYRKSMIVHNWNLVQQRCLKFLAVQSAAAASESKKKKQKSQPSSSSTHTEMEHRGPFRRPSTGDSVNHNEDEENDNDGNETESEDDGQGVENNRFALRFPDTIAACTASEELDFGDEFDDDDGDDDDDDDDEIDDGETFHDLIIGDNDVENEVESNGPGEGGTERTVDQENIMTHNNDDEGNDSQEVIDDEDTHNNEEDSANRQETSLFARLQRRRNQNSSGARVGTGDRQPRQGANRIREVYHLYSSSSSPSSGSNELWETMGDYSIANNIRNLPTLLQVNYDTCAREYIHQREASVKSGLGAMSRHISIARLRHQADRQKLLIKDERYPWIMEFRDSKDGRRNKPLRHRCDLIPDFPVDWIPYDAEMTPNPRTHGLSVASSLQEKLGQHQVFIEARNLSQNINPSSSTLELEGKEATARPGPETQVQHTKEETFESPLPESKLKCHVSAADPLTPMLLTPTLDAAPPARKQDECKDNLDVVKEETKENKSKINSQQNQKISSVIGYSEERAWHVLQETVSTLKEGGNEAMKRGDPILAAQRYDKGIRYCSLAFMVFSYENLQFLRQQHMKLLRQSGVQTEWTSLFKLLIVLRLNLALAMQKGTIADSVGAIDQCKQALMELGPFTRHKGKVVSKYLTSGCKSQRVPMHVYEEAKDMEAKAYFRMGTAQMSQKDYSGAIRSLEKSIKAINAVPVSENEMEGNDSKSKEKSSSSTFKSPDPILLKRLADAKREHARRKERYRKKLKFTFGSNEDDEAVSP